MTLATAGRAAIAPEAAGIRIAPDREEMVPVPDGRIYVRVNGDLKGPKPPIVLAHGGPGASHWSFLNATALASERGVILFDQLDCGRSDHPGDPANWTVDRYADELPAIAAYFGISRWHVLGASWGGTLALEYAAQRPAALASVIVQSPLIATSVWIEDANRLKDAMPAETRRLLYACDTPGAASKEECEEATEAFYRKHVRRFDPPADIAAYKAALPRSFSPDVYNYMWGRAEFTASGTLKDYDGRPMLKRLDGASALFVAGEWDEAVPATLANFAREVPGATFREIPHAAHMIMNDNPEAYLAVLREWLARHD